jgi:hypothetical protein
MDERWRLNGALLSLGAVLQFVQRYAVPLGADPEASADVASALMEIRDRYLRELGAQLGMVGEPREIAGEGGMLVPSRISEGLARILREEAR